MSIIECQLFRKEIIGGTKIQFFDIKEPTIIHAFVLKNTKRNGFLIKVKRRIEVINITF